MHLPTVVHLRAFEATARHKSFSRAALELNVTQTAVSHQIKALEGLLGQKLFDREPSIRLTNVGEGYLEAIRPLLLELSLSTKRALDFGKHRSVTVACLPGFASNCLIPRLKEFKGKHPDIKVNLRVLTSFEQGVRHEYDVAIMYGAGDWPGLEANRIFDEELFPVCSPSLLEGTAGPFEPGILRDYTLIRTDSLFMTDSWAAWLKMAGVAELEFSGEMTFNLLLPSLQAAVEGLGFVMGRSPIVARALSNGQLVAPFATKLRSSSAYYLVQPAGLTVPDEVDQFKDWMLGGFGELHGT